MILYTPLLNVREISIHVYTYSVCIFGARGCVGYLDYMYHSSLSRSAVHVMSTILRKEEKGRREGGREGGLDNGRLGWREGASEGAI